MAALKFRLSLLSSSSNCLRFAHCHGYPSVHHALSVSNPCPYPRLRPDHRPFTWCSFLVRGLTSTSNSNTNTNSTASFDWSDDDEDHEGKNKEKAKEMDKNELPPPYNPFSKKPVVEEPRDRSDLQEVFHKMRTEGLRDAAIKMFEALSKDGLTHEALELFSVIKDKGSFPDVVAHTAVIEAYANAGNHSKDVMRTFDRMLASGVLPNAYTYSVLIKGLARDDKLPEARKYLLEMMGKGMRPNAATYVPVFEAFAKVRKVDEARALLDEMKGKGFRPDEKAVREQLGKRGQVFRSIMNLLFDK